MQVIRKGILPTLINYVSTKAQVPVSKNTKLTLEEFILQNYKTEKELQEICDELKLLICEDIYSNGLSSAVVPDNITIGFDGRNYKLELRFFPEDTFKLRESLPIVEQSDRNSFVDVYKTIIAFDLMAKKYCILPLQGRLMDSIGDRYMRYKICYIKYRDYAIKTIMETNLVDMQTHTLKLFKVLDWAYGTNEYNKTMERIKL